MKILYALDYLEGGTFHVAAPLAEALRKVGHDVELVAKDTPISDKEFDLVHAWNIRAGALFGDEVILVQTINSFVFPYARNYIESAKRATKVHTHSPYVAQFLYTFAEELPASFIPVAFDQGRCPYALPAPKEFTLGWLGSDRSFKRFAVAREIAKQANVPYVEWDVDALYPWEKVRTEFFPNISCYLLASMNDAGPLPPQEALLFGRPVITTSIGMMNMIVRDGINGKLFDGSVEDGITAVEEIKNHYQLYRREVSNTELPTIAEVLPQYIHLYKMALDA